MLVKQRDNEIAILLNYLNKKKAQGEDVDVPGLPVHRSNENTQDTTKSSYKEERKETLYQRMSPKNEKTATQKRMDFELA